VLVSIPRQAIFDPAALPVTPFRSFTIVALPLWGTLLLFATGVALARRPAAYQLSMSGRPTALLIKGRPSQPVGTFD